MIDLSAIKSEKLRNLLNDSIKFAALSEEEQIQRVAEMSKFSAETQDKVYVPFFEKENAEEEPQREEIAQAMLEDYQNADKRVSMIEREDAEQFDRGKEVVKGENLINQLKNS